MKLTRDFYRPHKYEAKIQPKGIDAEIYLVDYGTPGAIAFGGKRSKPDFNYRFRSAEARTKHIKEYIEGMKASQAFKAELKANRESKGRGLEVGDVLYCSWGYDQTNIDYYEVTELVGKKSVRIIPISSVMTEDSKPPQDMVKPARGVPRSYDVLLGLYDGWQEKYPNGVLKRAKDSGVVIESGRHWAYKCDPNEARYETSLGWGH